MGAYAHTYFLAGRHDLLAKVRRMPQASPVDRVSDKPAVCDRGSRNRSHRTPSPAMASDEDGDEDSEEEVPMAEVATNHYDFAAVSQVPGTPPMSSFWGTFESSSAPEPVLSGPPLDLAFGLSLDGGGGIPNHASAEPLIVPTSAPIFAGLSSFAFDADAVPGVVANVAGEEKIGDGANDPTDFYSGCFAAGRTSPAAGENGASEEPSTAITSEPGRPRPTPVAVALGSSVAARGSSPPLEGLSKLSVESAAVVVDALPALKIGTLAETQMSRSLSVSSDDWPLQDGELTPSADALMMAVEAVDMSRW